MAPGLLLDTLIYLAAAVLVVPLAKRIGLGSVLGYLIAGVLIGPFVFGYLGEQGEGLMHFAEFGVVMMLFLVGLELEPNVLWRLRTPILGMGGLQVLATAVLCMGIAMGFGFAWQPALAIGMTFSVSSTAIVLQTLGEKGLLGTAGGRSAFAVLLFQDIAVIPMLAVLPLLAVDAVVGHDAGHDEHATTLLDGWPGWAQALGTLGAVALVIVAGRYLVPPLLRYVARTRQRELLTGVALLLVVTTAVLMTAVGLSPALGSFLGGVVLANSYYRHELESDLEPFKGLLLGLFFMAVGASIDFELVAARPGLIVGLLGLLLLVKWLVLYGLGRGFRLGADQNMLFAFGLAQTGEFAFVLLSLIDQRGILDPEVVGILLVVVALSMAVTPLMMMFNERVLQPRLGTTESGDASATADDIDEKRRIIVAGFGTFGAIVSRFLGVNGVRATILDSDSDRVELLRGMGFEVYYGDATRFDLLETAGAAEAEAIIIGLPEPELNLQLVETVKRHFPNLHIIVRAFDYADTYELMDAGVLHIHRETIDNGVAAATDALKLLGFRSYQLRRQAARFRAYDERALKSLAAARSDPGRYAETVRSAVADAETLLVADLDPTRYARDVGWDAASMVEEYGGG